MAFLEPRRDEESGDLYQPVEERGRALLRHPHLNKGTAFPEDERDVFRLRGLLPPRVVSMDKQLARVYEGYSTLHSDLEKNVYLAALQDRNEVLFYRLVLDHLEEMTPVLYTPVVAEACRNWSHIWRRARGLYVAPNDRGRMEQVLRNAPGHPQVIVVTDNERILGIGDQGAGGMGIPIGKLALYTLGAGIHPAHCLPVSLDVGTDNGDLLRDPLYIGWPKPRMRGEEYWSFVDEFVAAVKRVFPHALLQWEDFAKGTSFRHLETHRESIASFNDDIQGTAAVALAGLLGALRIAGGRLSDQRIVLLGAGSAGVGISRLIVDAMQEEGMSRADAHGRIYTLDSHGLVVSGRPGLDSHKLEFAVEPARIASWGATGDEIPLAEVVRRVKPTVLIGVSGRAGAFSEEVIRSMASVVARPIVFPLSNPTACSEAKPADLLRWTEGRAIVATGSPFSDVLYDGRRHRIGQGNNVFIFPGVGLGTVASKARKVTDGMFLAAAKVLASRVPGDLLEMGSVFPRIQDVRATSRAVAEAVARRAIEEGVADPVADLPQALDRMVWQPRYLPYRPV